MFSSCSSQAGVGKLSWTLAESHKAFLERVIANFGDKNVVLYNQADTGNFWLSRDYYESRIGTSFIESSTKTGCLSVKAQAKYDVFR